MNSSAIAIVGLAGRFPGAGSVSRLWENLRDGVESIRNCTDAELIAAGVSESELQNPDYVKRASILENVSMFDAGFFGFSPRDASIMDPQHRHFLECAWEAMEDAAHPPQLFDGSVGVFAGSGMNTYLIHNLLQNKRLLESSGLFQLKQTGNDKDVLATRVSYQFDLRGPSINVQTACSTSLVAVHLACQSLLNFECDMALAGGVTIEIPHGQGYTYREGEILSRDGHCRSFDANSSGTVFASGLGVVVLRRMEDALRDRDHIRAVILGSAINNDGARKVGYLAPSVEGQSEVIAEALDFAGAVADDISYVETHGTGTVVGDPIEIRALTKAFRGTTARNKFCAIGSLKSNLGHLDAAAGVSGLIKTVLALENEAIPASLHFKNPNPHIDFANSPFFVNSELRAWPSNETPRRAGVTSLGIGGTNAHLVLEEAPRQEFEPDKRPFQLLVASAKSEAAADKAIDNLKAFVREHPDTSIGDIAYTSQIGRAPFTYRRAVVTKGLADPGGQDRFGRIASGVASTSKPSIIFMFSGQGSQYVGMARGLYQQEPEFRSAMDECARHLKVSLGLDLIEAIYPIENVEAAEDRLNQTWLTQPALFSIEYALARWWMSLGVIPDAMVGHSIGEYVAACLAGVFSLEDGLKIVAERGRLIFGLPSGKMLAVSARPTDLPLNGTLSLAAVNAPEMCVVSGPADDVDRFERELAGKSVSVRKLHTSHAFHSKMMDPILGDFERVVSGIRLNAPSIPYTSNVNGTWIGAEEATDASYWAKHIRQAVRFSECIAVAEKLPNPIFLEVGPGNVLTSLVKLQGGSSVKAFQTTPHPRETQSDLECALHSMGALWVAGFAVDLAKLHAPGTCRRVSLPTYPFEHQRYWIEPDQKRLEILAELPDMRSTSSPEESWFYRRIWKNLPAVPSQQQMPGCWILFRDSLGLSDQVAKKLALAKVEYIVVESGSTFKQTKRSRYSIRPGERADYDELITQIIKDGFAPRTILHFWSMTAHAPDIGLGETFDRSFFSPLYLAQALGLQDISGVEIGLVSNDLQRVHDEPVKSPARAVCLGPARTITKELPGLGCRSIDLDLREPLDRCAARLVAEMGSSGVGQTVAYRGADRFVEELEKIGNWASDERVRLEKDGVYLITGGLGGLGLEVAEYLAREFSAKLILVSRRVIAEEKEWKSALESIELPEAEREILTRLARIREFAGGLLILSGDVADREGMKLIVDRSLETFERIDGAFHAAGVLDDQALMLKSPESVRHVLNPKVRGAFVLDDVLSRAKPKFCVLFSSISAIYPAPGQIDYAAANAFLDAFAQAHPERMVAVNWDAWQAVGMAAKAQSPHPLLRERLVDTSREIIYQSRFSIGHQWLLAEHRLKSGSALVPGTGYLEMVAGAFSRGTLHAPIEFRDVVFLAPLMFEGEDAKEVRVQLVQDKSGTTVDGSYQFKVLAKQNRWIQHAAGTIGPCLARPETWIEQGEINRICGERSLVFDEQRRTRQEEYFDFGPRWRCLQTLSLGDRQGLAELQLDPRYAKDMDRYSIHPALLDLATGCSLYLTGNYETTKDLYLPFSYKRLRIFEKLPPHFFSYIRGRKDNQLHGAIETFDITLFASDNKVLAEIEGFAMRRIENAAEAVGEMHAVIDAAEEEVALESERPGIPPELGIRALAKILESKTPANVVVMRGTPMERGGAGIAKHKLSAAANVPGEDVETTLVEWWKELLGVERVNPDDDFFSLGGHSLVGIRLFAKIKKTYQVDLELGVLFEARTVRQLAKLIEGRRSPDSQVVSTKAFSSLIPIQPSGTRIPLFCVHAIGGDVLFYEKLAKSLGMSQPFYAFRSPLVTESGSREISIEELASLYIKEMRAFFPEGPYLLGGLSFGGLVAYEMAQQLKKQGIDPRLLILFDTTVPGSIRDVETSDQLRTFWQQLREQGPGYLMRKAEVKRNYWARIMREKAQSAVCRFYVATGKEMPADLRYFQVQETHGRALERYAFQRYSGKVTLMRAVDRGHGGMEILSKREDPALGWTDLAGGGLEIHDVPAGHSSMLLEPWVRTVAEMLKTILPTQETTDSQRVSVA